MTVVVILAGGLGTRLRGAVPDLPKPMAPVNGEPFLAYLMSYWIKQGATKFIISVGYKREIIINFFSERYKEVPVEFAEELTPLGTGGALILAIKNLHQSFVLLNGDTFFEVSLQELEDFHRSKNAACSFSLFRANEVNRYGALSLNSDGKIQSLATAKGQIGQLANGGVYMIDPNVFHSSEFIPGEKYSLEDDLFPTLLNKGVPLFGFESTGNFLDIGVPKDYLKAPELLPRMGEH